MALAGWLESATFRYRVGQFVEPLARLGVEVEAREVPRERAGRRAAFADLGDFHVVWLLRRTFPRSEARALRRSARLLIFDIDDAVWSRDSNRLLRRSLKRRSRFRRTAAMADLVVAGNPYLGREARRYNSRVAVVPTCLDLARYRPRERHDPREAVELVWIGQKSTLGYLQGIMPAIEAFARCRPVRLRVIADAFPEGRRVEVVPVPWSAETEAEELAHADIGLAPLSDDRWSRGKCGLKVLQYMASGLPVVASPVGVQVEMIGRGERGRLAASPGEWVKALAQLADDPEERLRCGRAGRAFAEENYSLDLWAPRLARLFHALVEGRPIEDLAQ